MRDAGLNEFFLHFGDGAEIGGDLFFELAGDLVAAIARLHKMNVVVVLSALRSKLMSSHMPPVPPANRSPKGPGGSDPKIAQDTSLKHEEPQNTSEQGETANIKQNTTNEGFFRGRRIK